MNAIDDLKITCVTITKNRFDLLVNAISCYIDQTYINKELLIASQGDDVTNSKIKNHLNFLGRKDIRLFPVDSNLSLGELRKKAAWEAYGDIVCQWDDDDFYHPKRLSTQYWELIKSNSMACYYDSHLKYFKKDRKVYGIDWSVEKGEPWHKILGGSVMYYKKYEGRYLDIVNFYPHKDCYEDVDFAQKVFENYPVVISKKGYQYVYVYHGNNVYNESHHYAVLKSKRVYTKSEMCKNYSHISESLSKVDDPILVMGSDGIAFNLEVKAEGESSAYK